MHATQGLGSPLAACPLTSRRLTSRPGPAAAAASKKGKAAQSYDEEDKGRYPDRTPFTGGWAGGEVGLKQFVKDGEDETRRLKEKNKKYPSSKWQAPDDPKRLPGKENYLGLPLAGGFAGGERGLREFVDTGDLKISKPDPRGQSSPLVVALLVAGFGVVGGLLLEDGVELAEKALSSGLPGSTNFQLDDSTKLALQAGLALLALTGTGVGIRAIVKQVRDGTGKLATQAINFGKVAVFWVAVFVAFKYILENS